MRKVSNQDAMNHDNKQAWDSDDNRPAVDPFLGPWNREEVAQNFRQRWHDKITGEQPANPILRGDNKR